MGGIEDVGMVELENGQTVEDGCDSLLMPVCGSVGGGEPLWEWNGIPWELFVENQCRGRTGTDTRSNLVGRGKGREPQTERLVLWLVWNLPHDGN